MNALDYKIKRFKEAKTHYSEEIFVLCNFIIAEGADPDRCRHLADKAEMYIDIAQTLRVLLEVAEAEKEETAKKEEAKKPKSDTPEYTVHVKVIRRKEKPNEN